MNQRSFTGILVLGVLMAAILYMWQPWNPGGALKLGLDLQGGLRVVLQSDDPNPDPEDLQAARRVIENRVNEFGVAEPVIQTSGANRVIVELPGLTAEEQNRAQDLIGQQAILEFRLVRQGANDPLTPDKLEPPAFTGEVLRGAQVAYNQLGQPIVTFQIRGQDAGAFGQFTGGNLGRRMAVVLDGNVITAPNINGRISDSGEITGSFTVEEATDLALVLRSGSLPISLSIEEIRAIGPTLGQDSIAAGTTAALIGGVAVVAAILLYYGPLFGGVLTVGLIYVMLLIFGILSGLGAALTLPGLAGLVLTIGAAVDGNVISFERIKEELREGKSLRLSMRSGFGSSLSAIIDANVTTLLAAAALYQYTSGPVRGFAITLAIGIVSAVFVNTVVVPFLLDVLTVRFKKPLLPTGFYVTDLKFVKRAPIVMSISGALAVIALLIVIVSPLNLSTDFTGGTSALYNVPENVTVEQVRTAINELALPGVDGSSATVQQVEDDTISTEASGAAGVDETAAGANNAQATAGKLISVRIGVSENSASGGDFPNLLAERLNAQLLQADFVGPSVGEDLRNGAVLAVLVSLGLILLYVGLRFWPNWIVAIAAIVASIHDVGIVMGFLDLINAQFGVPVLAALLFVVGYSLNDSIIIADRIRENLRKVRGKSYEEIVDLSVSQTLSRTVMTSGTTLLPVLALFFFGGSVLRDFSITLLVGIGFGTYSSIFILAPMVAWFKKRQRKPKTSVRKSAA